jgi:hypothetical protein
MRHRHRRITRGGPSFDFLLGFRSELFYPELGVVLYLRTGCERQSATSTTSKKILLGCRKMSMLESV